jgi:hypothetical protein
MAPGNLSRYSDGLRAERLVLDSRQGQDIFFFSAASRLALGPTQPPIQWVPVVKGPGREANHSPPSSVEVKNGGAIPPLPHMPS